VVIVVGLVVLLAGGGLLRIFNSETAAILDRTFRVDRFPRQDSSSAHFDRDLLLLRE
jgi:hypothetical protein